MPGSRIVLDAHGRLTVPSEPIVPVVPGHGPGARLVEEVRRAIDEAVDRTHGARRRIHWRTVDAGEASMRSLRTAVPDATVQAIRVHRIALVGALPAVEDDSRTLESELDEILDLFLGCAPVGPDGQTLLYWENRETSATRLALEEGGSDSAAVQASLAETRGENADAAPGWAVSMTSRHGTERFVQAAVAHARSQRGATEAAVLHADGDGEPPFLRWARQVATDPLESLPISTALSRLMKGQALPGVVLSSATQATQLLRLAHATAQGALAAGRSNPETGHWIFGPLRDDLPEPLLGTAMTEAARLLLVHLGWTQAADALAPADLAKAS